ncbi:MAG: hypothetical protein ACKVGZ_20850, partial [Alphaproteobacteria bacterium]
LQGTGVPAPFTVAWESRPLANVAKAEAAAHLRLSGHREYKNREFFRLSLSDALPALEAAEAKQLDQAWLEKERQRKQAEERWQEKERQRKQAEERWQEQEERRRKGRLAEQASVVMAWRKWKASPAYRAAVREIEPSRQRWWDSSILKQFVRALVYAGSLLLLLWRPSLVVDLLGLMIFGMICLSFVGAIIICLADWSPLNAERLKLPGGSWRNPIGTSTILNAGSGTSHTPTSLGGSTRLPTELMKFYDRVEKYRFLARLPTLPVGTAFSPEPAPL